MKTIIFIAITLIFANTKSILAQELIFQSGFESGCIGEPPNEINDIIGADSSLSKPNDWVDDLENHPKMGVFKIYYNPGGTVEDRYARIVADPENPKNKVLKFWAKNATAKQGEYVKTRIQADIYNNTNLDEIFIKFKLYIHQDYKILEENPAGMGWMTIMEFWNDPGWMNYQFPFRVSVNITKSDGVGKKLHITVSAQEKTDNNWISPHLWSVTNKDFEVQYNKWMQCEVYFKEGDSTNGKFYFAITPQGAQKTVLCNVTNYTHHRNNIGPKDGLTHFNPFKLYTSEKYTKFVTERGGVLQLFFDDFELWSSMPKN